MEGASPGQSRRGGSGCVVAVGDLRGDRYATLARLAAWMRWRHGLADPSSLKRADIYYTGISRCLDVTYTGVNCAGVACSRDVRLPNRISRRVKLFLRQGWKSGVFPMHLRHLFDRGFVCATDRANAFGRGPGRSAATTPDPDGIGTGEIGTALHFIPPSVLICVHLWFLPSSRAQARPLTL